MEEVELSVEVTSDGRVRLDKLLAQAGLAESVSDAVRKLKQKAVRVNGDLQTDSAASLDLTKPVVLQVGRRVRRIRATIAGGTKPADNSLSS